MPIPLEKKSTIDEIRQRFDQDVERFSNLTSGQTATMEAPPSMELITAAARQSTPNSRRILDIGCGAGSTTLKLLQSVASHCCHVSPATSSTASLMA